MGGCVASLPECRIEASEVVTISQYLDQHLEHAVVAHTGCACLPAPVQHIAQVGGVLYAPLLVPPVQFLNVLAHSLQTLTAPQLFCNVSPQLFSDVHAHTHDIGCSNGCSLFLLCVLGDGGPGLLLLCDGDYFLLLLGYGG